MATTSAKKKTTTADDEAKTTEPIVVDVDVDELRAWAEGYNRHDGHPRGHVHDPGCPLCHEPTAHRIVAAVLAQLTGGDQ